MKSKPTPKEESQEIYKSFEQWRAELFPDLVMEERKRLENKDTKKLGLTLANESFDRLLKTIQA